MSSISKQGWPTALPPKRRHLLVLALTNGIGGPALIDPSPAPSLWHWRESGTSEDGAYAGMYSWGDIVRMHEAGNCLFMPTPEAADAAHDGYTKITTHEWHFDVDDGEWSMVMSVLGDIAIVRREEAREEWYIELTIRDGVWTLNDYGYDRSDHAAAEPMPDSVPAAVEAYIRAHGVPS